MKAKAIQRNIHISPRKAGLVCDLIKNKPVARAITILDNTDKKAASIIKKILNSAIANATNNHAMDADKLYVYSAVANQGTTMKRALPRAKGSSNMIRKRHSHIEIIISDDPTQRNKDLMTIKAKKSKKLVNNKNVKVTESSKPVIKLPTSSRKMDKVVDSKPTTIKKDVKSTTKSTSKKTDRKAGAK